MSMVVNVVGRRFSGWVSRPGLRWLPGVLGIAVGILVAMTKSGGEAQLALIPTAIAVGVATIAVFGLPL